ncbi:glycosyltransferase family 39 protein [Mycolicibacterium celeriflavum]|uniref:Membrane protein n=1 Tax=Mycolicibacterium celeriflavum TaxID=1249101 RepID=A0A7I7REZ8_MYCCF|nr:glycosyltransferase family 39 protein [Mycolicibacterium celeriflavum]MCV7240032.1 glycosyltransferase family 39 protein [Mycolicibacterium celeriflavum]BBY42676.1 membrane protein [Mycolicibacterium celeriflavum]
MELSPGAQRLARLERSESVRTGRLDAALVAVFAVAVSAAGAARPSLWFDEAATISASTRTIPELWRLLHNIDAVHGTYYLLMHGWFTVFPVTEFYSRLSSCLAVGVAAAGVVVLARRFWSRTLAACAGIMFAILPRITWAGIETRSYALTAAAAVWMTVLLLVAVRRNSKRLWACYGLAVVACSLLNVFAVLLVLVHAVALAAVAANRAVVHRWIVTVAVAIAAVVPFLVFSRTQIAQVRWISAPGWDTVAEVVQEQYFDHSVAFAVVAAAVLILPLVRRRFRPTDAGVRSLVLISLGWIVVPTAVLLLYSVWLEPVYYPRYLSYTSPAMALLLAVGVTAIARTRETVAAVLTVFAVAATPNYLLEQRGPYAKEGMDFSQVADVITAHASPGDCLVLDNTTNWAPGPIRPLTAARPQAYAQLVDPGRGPRAADRNRLWDAHLGIWGVADQLRRCTVLWTVSQRDTSVADRESGTALDPGPRLRRAPAYRVPQAMGFRVVERWQFSFAQVVKSTR